MKKSEVINIRISTEDKDQLTNIAQADNRTISNLIQKLIKDYLYQHDKPKREQRIREIMAK